MTSLILPHRIQHREGTKLFNNPFAPVKLKRENRFSKNLEICCLPSANPAVPLELVGNLEPVTSTGILESHATPDGMLLSGNASAIVYDVTGMVTTNTQFSMFALMKRNSSLAVDYGIMALSSQASGNDRIEVKTRGAHSFQYVAFFKKGGVSISSVGGSMALNELIPVMLTRYSDTNMTLNVPGSAFTTTANMGSIVTDRLTFMAKYAGGAYEYLEDVSMLMGCLWNSPLDQTDVEEFLRNPAQLIDYV